MTLVVDDTDGKRVRNFFARRPHEVGRHEQEWDLRDEMKAFVAPGRYRWKAIAGPALELRYAMSVYPNVMEHHPENTAWLNARSGPGGWLADHSPPRSVATVGDYVFLGAPTPEHGVGFAAVDLDGRKRWGIHSFAPFSGGTGLATDGTTVFVEHMGRGLYGATDEGADRIWAVDIASQRHSRLLTAPQTERRLRGIANMAARDGKLFLAVNATENWLGNAAGWSDVSIEDSLPRYREARAPLRPYEIVPDKRDDFLRLFRLKGAPPGYGHRDGGGLIWLESTRGPGRRQHIMLTFNRPVPIGTCVFPVPQDEEYVVRLSALKPDAPYPPSPGRSEDWIPFETHGELGWDAAIAPPNTRTRALLITFVRGGDDEWADLLGPTTAGTDPPSIDDRYLFEDPPADVFSGGDSRAWQGRIAGMRLLSRRFQNHFAEARISVNSGKVDAHGIWEAERMEPLSSEAPAIYMMEWDEARALRGVAIEEIDGARAEIDVFTGPADAAIELEGDANWEKVGVYVPRRRMDHPGFQDHNAHALYMDGTVDFGREMTTRAVRIRVVAQWISAIDTRTTATARDQLGIDPTRCRVFGVAPLEYIGGEFPVDELIAHRIEVIDGATGVMEHEVAISRPTQIAFAPDGALYGIAEGRLVKIDLENGRHESPFVVTTEKPGALAFDRRGNIYLYDAAPARRVIHVYSPEGRLLRTIGEPAGYEAGPWNPQRFNHVSSIAVDQRNQLWVVDTSSWPKRISCWTIEGEWLRDHYGHTRYGGGGVLDPENTSRLFYGPLEFEIDWETGRSRLKNLTWTGRTPAGEVPIRMDGRTYLVTRPEGTRHQRAAVVYLYDEAAGKIHKTAAMGQAAHFSPLRESAILARVGNRRLDELQFIWTDVNGDGQVQYEEVTFAPLEKGRLSSFGRDLTILAGSGAFEVERFLENGAPVYRWRKTPAAGNFAYRRTDGGYFILDNGLDKGVSAEGLVEWTYPNEGMGVGPDRSAGAFTPEQVLGQFYVVGHEVAAGGDLGEFFVVNANLGSWNVWTTDGLLAGRIFRDLRDGQRVSWTMPGNDRGMRLDDVTAGQEHFNGWFTRSREDDRYFAVAGHNHASIVEVSGLDDFRRTEGTFEITEDDITANREWQREQVGYESREAPRVIDIYTLDSVDRGRVWEVTDRNTLPDDSQNPDRAVAFQIARDPHYLLARWEVVHAGPFRNSAAEWDWLFQGGAAVDLMLGLDPAADPHRRAPVAGDKRIIVARHKGSPVVVLYDAIVPGAPSDHVWETATPAGGRTAFDVVRRIDNANVTVRDEANGYVIELALPLREIGLDPEHHGRIRFDWGILETDEHASSVLRRSYWSNQAASTVADAPTEARLEANLWGWALFQGHDRSRPTMRDSFDRFGDDDAMDELDALLDVR